MVDQFEVPPARPVVSRWLLPKGAIKKVYATGLNRGPLGSLRRNPTNERESPPGKPVAVQTDPLVAFLIMSLFGARNLHDQANGNRRSAMFSGTRCARENHLKVLH